LNSKRYKTHKIFYYLSILFVLLCIVLFCLYHYYDYTFYNTGPSCGFVTFLHCYCPGCGGSRAVDAFLHGNFLRSVLCHPVIVYVFLLFMAYFLPATYTFVIKRDGNLHYKFHLATLWGLLIIVTANFILRNILLIFFQIDYLQDCFMYW